MWETKGTEVTVAVVSVGSLEKTLQVMQIFFPPLLLWLFIYVCESGAVSVSINAFLKFNFKRRVCSG